MNNKTAITASDSAPKLRDANFELLRIISMLLVILLHFNVYGKLLTAEFGTPLYVVAWLAEAIGYKAVDIFVIISGYFLVKTKLSAGKVFRFYIQVFTYSAGLYLLSCLLNFREFTLLSFFKAATPISSYEYWFVTRYFVMLLLSPILNLLISKLTKKQHLLCIGLLLFIYCIWQSIVVWNIDVFSDGNNLEWFVVLYFIGSYFRLYDTKISPKKAIFLSLAADVLLFFSRYLTGVVTLNIFGRVIGSGFLFSYRSPLVVFSAITIFLCFKNLVIKSAAATKIIPKISALAFGVYLSHNNLHTLNHLWNFVFPARFSNNVFLLILYMIVSTLAIYAVCGMVEYIRAALYNLLGFKKIEQKLNSFFSRILSKVK
ncbi:MAG: acyltransferase [Clostridia bacterium]|nr:acyltransferase [Clostridia bacterium]